MAITLAGPPLLLLLLLNQHQAAATKWFLFGRQHIFDVDNDQKTARLERNEDTLAEEKWIEQPLDHFDPLLQAEGRRWRQRYFEVVPTQRQRHQQQKEQQFQQQEEEQDVPPMFVYIGGEAEISPKDITAGHFAALREAFGADAFALEHRFYGRSQPLPTSDSSSLRWLTAEQALADLALFVDAKRRERAEAYGTSPHAIPVVVFGCSYPGALAAFSRSKYPFLISGAISSSSPLKAKETFWEFDLAVKDGLPPDCRAAAAAAIAALDARVSQGLMARELRRFGCEDIPSSTELEKTAFIYSVVDAVSEAVQYERRVERPLVELLCSSLGAATKKREATPGPDERHGDTLRHEGGKEARLRKEGSEELHNFAGIVKAEVETKRSGDGMSAHKETAGRKAEQDSGETAANRVEAAEAQEAKEDKDEQLLNGLAHYFSASLLRKKATCKDVNMLAATSTTLDNSVLSSTRLWMWQSCTQFGFWQVGSARGLRPESIDVQFHLRVCNRLFPLPKGSLADAGIEETNLWGGGTGLAALGAATDIHFTNGEKDPWRTLSVSSIPPHVQERQRISAFVIKGGSHCTDFYSPASSDSAELTAARSAIKEAISGFVARLRANRSGLYLQATTLMHTNHAKNTTDAQAQATPMMHTKGAKDTTEAETGLPAFASEL